VELGGEDIYRDNAVYTNWVVGASKVQLFFFPFFFGWGLGVGGWGNGGLLNLLDGITKFRV